MEDFIGFDSIIDGFSKRAKNNSLSHAHLIVGPNGIGKSILAKIFSLRILKKVVNKDYIDIVHYKPKKASFGVEEVRSIIEEVNKKPFEGDKKVIIIHEGNKLTVQAQNALLKTIEEPPTGVYIIILSESLELMLDTIKSRSQIYKLTPLSKNEMERFILKIGDYNKEKLLLALAYAEGIPGRAERILKDTTLQELRDLIVDLLKEIDRNQRDVIMKYEGRLIKYKGDKEEVLNLIALFIRDIMISKELDKSDMIINIDKENDIKNLANDLSFKKLNLMLRRINEARTSLKNNVSYSMIICVLLIGFLED